MFPSWLADDRPAAPGHRRPPVRLALEELEDRSVPSAIRNIPGFTVNTFPVGGTGLTQVLPGGGTDDGSSNAVNVGFNLNFFGVQTNQVFVNNNGNITFGQPLSQFTPTALNTDNGGIPIIAPFFADVDTSVPPSPPSPGGVTTFGTDTLCGLPAFGVDWIRVGYFSGHVDKLNSFQLILVSRPDTGPGNFDIEFNYDQIQWEAGDASGGTNGLGGESARVGYSNGSGQQGTFFELPGSGVNGAFLDNGPMALVGQTMQSSTPGRLHFLVRNGQVIMQQTMVENLDVTAGTRVFDPFRWITDPATGLQHGNITLENVSTPGGAGGLNACLDEPSGNPNQVQNNTFPGPITVVFPRLPDGVTLANPTGVTASGKPFITLDVTGLPRNSPVARVRVEINNPTFDAPSTFFTPFPVQVFAGAFDPTKA